MSTTFQTILETYATSVTNKFTTQGQFQPEDQLKTPVTRLLEDAGILLGLEIRTVTEVQIAELGGRPDVGVYANGLLCGHVELKQPGLGANTSKLSGRNKEQWAKFQNLPNLIYTDGQEWALYRTGELVGRRIRLAGDVTVEAARAVSADNIAQLSQLLQDFLLWEPIVPHTPRALANLLAPLCRLLRVEVETSLKDKKTDFYRLADDWRTYFFPDANDSQFADAYAQTITYSLLLAQLQGVTSPLTISKAFEKIQPAHNLLADALNILAQPNARKLVGIPISLLERVIGAIDPVALRQKSQGDPWLYFYEDFLAAYDAKLRKSRGVYYTPVQVVQAQVRLVAELLADHFGADYSFADKDVVTLDPATGTGAYITAALEHALAQVEEAKGAGMRANYATQAAHNIHGFEVLVGPYAVAHMRFTQQVSEEGGTLPPDGVHIFLADTLDSPHQPPPPFPFAYKALAEEHQKAQKIKASTPVLVCIGNPPYDRQQLTEEEQETVQRKGGWVRFGDKPDNSDAILQDFLRPLDPLGYGVHAKNLYNDYVYFWRWALWKVFASPTQGGIVSFITASSYLRGQGFAGMRQLMRQTFDELWLIDLEGDNLGARKTENVFAIQTPVCIAVGMRYGPAQPTVPARVHYTRLEGSSEQKLATLAHVHHMADLPWQECMAGWTDLFLPPLDKRYGAWPLLTDLFPWQENGIQFKRTWPIGETAELLTRRWQTLLQAPTPKAKGQLLKEATAGQVSKQYKTLDKQGNLPSLADLPADAPATLMRYAYRSFDRQWAIQDVRLCDRPRPELQAAHGEKQVYLTSLLTKVLGKGPSAIGTAHIPDMDYFCGRGAKDVIPLWRNREGSSANVVQGLLSLLQATYQTPVAPEELFAYAYAILFAPRYVQTFWEELTIPGPRLPLTQDGALFAQGVALGKRLLHLHTYGERFVPAGQRAGKLPMGKAQCKVGTPSAPEKYPESFDYDEADQELRVGEGVFAPVRPEVWEFAVSGLEVVKSWLAYRLRNRKGKKSSPLNELRPAQWTFDDELLDLLWVLDGTVDLLPAVNGLLEQVLAGPLFTAKALPQPTKVERQREQSLALFALVETGSDELEDENEDEDD